MPGFPIRKSSDHSSVDSSPRPIAASHVLHRLLMPRHPPCALKHLFTTRCSHPLCNTQHTTTPQPTTTTTTPTHTRIRAHRDALDGPGQEQPEKTPTGVFSGPNSVPNPPRTKPRNNHESIVMFHPATPTNKQQAWNQGKGEPNSQHHQPPGPAESRAGQPHHTVRLLRKEVIQPHLPVRLPCYDFVPIASPTFDNSLPRRG